VLTVPPSDDLQYLFDLRLALADVSFVLNGRLHLLGEESTTLSRRAHETGNGCSIPGMFFFGPAA
jgi:hypothetical protein